MLVLYVAFVDRVVGDAAVLRVLRLTAPDGRRSPSVVVEVTDLLPEAQVAPPPVRQLRALLRHRAQLVRLRTLLRNRIHAVLADHGYDRPAGCWSGPGRA